MSSPKLRLEKTNDAQIEDPESDDKAVSELQLRGERTLSVVHAGAEDLIEVRAASGVLELRVRMTPEGPVLQMESVRISLKATEAVDVACKRFSVDAAESLDLRSGGGMRVSGEADVRVDANGEVRVQGTMIYLN